MSDPNPDGAREAPRRRPRSMLLALSLLIAIGVWIWWQGSERRAIRNLPVYERAALYQRTLANVKTVCGSSDLALEEYCRDQARLLLEFPECDDVCREMASTRIGSRAP
jgi:hypothetical protein